MGLGLGYALAGLGQGLEQGIGNYLAQKRYERELAMQVRSADDAHRSAVLGDVVNYGYRPDGGPDQGASTPFPASAPPAPAPMVGTLLGRAASGPAAGTPSLSAGSVLGAQNGLPGVDAPSAPSVPVASVLSGAASASANDRVSVPGIGSIDPTNSMFGIRRMLAIADAQKAMGEARHQEMVNAAGPSGIDGTPEHAQYVTDLEARKALATLPAQMQLEVLRGRISLGNALTQAGVQHGYRTQEITQEGGIRGGLQQNEQQFERGLIIPRAQAGINAQQTGDIFKNQFSIPGRILQAIGATPTQPSVPMPNTGSAPTPQQADWDHAAQTLLQSGQGARIGELGPRP